MKLFLSKFVDSARELKNLRSLVGLSLFLSISIILSFFFRLDLGPTLRIGFSFLATAAMGMFYGPVAAGLAAGVGDIIKLILRPSGPWIPGLTLVVALSGMTYGMVLYKEKPTITRAIVAKTTVNIVMNSILNTYFLTSIYGEGFMTLFWPRLGKNAVMLLVEIPILFLFLTAAYKAHSQIRRPAH